MMNSIKRIGWLLATSALVACGAEADVDSPDYEIGFSDSNLEQCIRTSMGIPSAAITRAEALGLYALECQDAGIASLDGLEHFENLQSLSLWENQITDIDAIQSLSNIENLELGANDIADISPLNGLRAMKRLGLYGNGFSRLAYIGSSRGLEWLNIDKNQVDDVSVLAGLPALRWLTLEGNPISTPHIVDTLRSSGVEVFDGSEVPTSKSGVNDTNSWMPETSVSSGGLQRRFTWLVERDDSVSFTCDVGGQILDVIQEYAGDIYLEKSQFIYRRGDLEVVVGEGTLDGWSFCTGNYAHACELSLGVMDPATSRIAPGFEGQAKPICTASLTVRQPSSRFYANSIQPNPSSDKDLMDYVLASPNQFDAGTCLFMSSTGSMEILMNQHRTMSDVDYMGETDLSERFLMNASGRVPTSALDYTITDVTETYNYFGGSLLNRDYPFTAGYMKEDASGNLRPADANEEGAYFTCSLNWVDDLPEGWENTLTPTPKSDRTMIAIDPNLTSSSIWNVGLFNDEVIERVKYELRVRNAPVVIVYNHYLYWHADIIVGYDDDASIGECPMVKSTIDHFKDQGSGGYATLIENHMAKEGGCANKGVFYVRDSIYDGTSEEPMYSYSDDYSFEERYSQRIVERSYDWVKYLSNHAYVVHRQ